MTSSTSNQQVLLRIAGQLFGIPVHCVSEMIQLPPLTELPKSPSTVRGIFIQRGKTLAALDFRSFMGTRSLKDEIGEFRTMLDAREQDHRNWIKELELSVEENRAFSLATDPHKCAFGKWYDNYETDSALIGSHLEKFEEPHNRIHALAIEVAKLVAEDRVDEAKRRITAVRGSELSEMIGLFQQFKELLDETSREIAIVLCAGVGNGIAYCVDSVEGVLDIPPDENLDPAKAEGGITDLVERGLTPALIGPNRELALLVGENTLYAPLGSVLPGT